MARASQSGKDQHADARAKIGDPSAPPAPPEPTSLPEPCRHHVIPHGVWPTFLELFRRFSQDECPAYAAALAFFSILSLVPILLVAIAALAFIVGNPHQAVGEIQKLISGLLPGQAANAEAQRILLQRANIEATVRSLIQTRGIAEAVGILSLIWAAIQIFVNGAPAMNAAYEVQETRGWIKLRLLALGLFVGAGILFLISLLPTSGPQLVSKLHFLGLGQHQPAPWWFNAICWVVALAINITMFALIYKYLPNIPTTWREAFVGGALTGVLWELAKRGFAFYLGHFASYNKVYGALGGLIILILWIYYTGMILLLGAEAAALYQDLREEARSPGRKPAAATQVGTGRRARA